MVLDKRVRGSQMLLQLNMNVCTECRVNLIVVETQMLLAPWEKPEAVTKKVSSS